MDQIEKFVKDSGLAISAYNVCFYDSNGTDEILEIGRASCRERV